MRAASLLERAANVRAHRGQVRRARGSGGGSLRSESMKDVVWLTRNARGRPRKLNKRTTLMHISFVSERSSSDSPHIGCGALNTGAQRFPRPLLRRMG